MSNNTNHQDVAKRRQVECRIEADAYALWLAFLGKTNWITDILPAALSLFAGAAIFGDLITDWKIWAGLAAFLSSILIVIHKRRNCDAHQAECKRLMKAYRGLEARYRTLHELGSAVDGANDIQSLETKLATIKETADARVPEKYREKAKSLA